MIHAPIQPLKDIQRTLAQILTASYHPPAQVHGFARGRSPVSNALRHPGQQWILRVDLQDFFPSIHFGRVRGVFRAFPFEYPADVATLLALICCHRNALPQGAPTSPIVSNYICRRMDRQLSQLAAEERCFFSRYADDITFSTDRRNFPPSLGYLDGGQSIAGPALRTAIEENNSFLINPAKTRLMHRSQRQRVTGLVVNEKVNVPRGYLRGLRSLLFIWKHHGPEAAIAAYMRANPSRNAPPGKGPPSFVSVVRGQVQYVGSIRGWGDPTYRALATSLAELDPDFTLREPLSTAPQTVRIFVEGPSDVEHLEAALSHFKAHDNLTDFEFHQIARRRHRAAQGLQGVRQNSPEATLPVRVRRRQP